jgi:formylmethanofuran dehydrogenase subunit C
MNTHAKGTFDVTMNPQPPYDTAEGVTLGRVSISKQFRGDLEAQSTVEMLSAITDVKGSAGYVALERVRGTLHGGSGGFVLQHSGMMTRGKAELTVSVVPDSGTGELKGLQGKMTIEVVNGDHLYTFDYTLDKALG